MTSVGIIGGIGPESTIQYYRLLIAAWREHRQDGSNPSIIINSIDMQRMLGLIASNELEDVTQYLVDEVKRLARAGADFGALASNTPHIVFDEVSRRSPIPLTSIVEATCDKAQTLNLKRVALFGTRFTMQGRFYEDVFSRTGITLVVPDEDEQRYIHDKYMNELLKNLFLAETRDHLLSIVDRLKAHYAIDGLILGGTELPLILTDDEHNGVRFLDTTRIHVERIAMQLLA